MSKQKQSGAVANENGTNLEDFIRNIICRCGYLEVPRKRFKPATYLEQAIFAQQFLVGKSIYGTDLICDFILYHPQRHPLCIVIESKWQQSSGSVDEKFPYLVLNIKTQTPYQTIIVLDGGGYKPLAEQWLRSEVDDKLLHVFNMAEFQKWANKGNL